MSMLSTASSSPRSITSSVTSRPLGWWMRSISTSPSQALTSHSSGGSSISIPAARSASVAASTSCGRITRSRSWRVSGPPRAQLARLPPSRNGMHASRSAAAERLSALSIAEKSSTVMPRGLPGYRRQMPIRSKDEPRGDVPELRVRIAATGDVHCSRDADREHWTAAFAGLLGQVDLVLLAGDLTTHGEPEQAAILADAVRGVEVPVLSVLGNHDWHANRRDELVAALREGGIDVLDREHRVLEVDGAEVGVVGCKGFVGGFPGSHMPDFGEPLLREVYAEGMREVEAVDAGLREVALCPFRIVLLHYSPATETLEGERRDIWAFLGSDRLPAPAPAHPPPPPPPRRPAPPIREHAPDLVLHGHAHAGTFAGHVAGVPVHNVSVPVMGEDFWVFEMTGPSRRPSA